MIADIWNSFRALPLRVQLWVALILVPVNAASLGFLAHPGGGWIALLAVGAMLLNLPIMLRERGLSKAMAWPHLLLWPPLLLLVLYRLQFGAPTPGFARYLWLLLAVDLVSLLLDFRDARHWLRGERQVAGR